MLARIASVIAAFGLPVTVLHFLPVHLSRDDKPRALGAIVGSILMPIVFGGAFALLLWSLSDWLALKAFRDPHAAIYIRNMAVLAPLMAVTEVLAHVARGFGSALHSIIIRNLAPPISYMVAIIYLSHFSGPKVAVTYSFVGAYTFSCILGLVLIAGFVRSVIKPLQVHLELRELYGYAFPVLLTTAVSIALLWTDLFQLGIFTNAGTVGIYRGCMQIVVVFDVIATTFYAAVGPIYPVLIAERRHEHLRHTYLAGVHLAILLATPVFLLILCNASDLLGLLGPQFKAGATPLCILAFGHLLKVSFGTSAVLLILGGRQRLEAFNTASAAVLNMLLNFLLIPRLGLVGASISTSTSLVVLSGLRLIQVSKAFPVTSLDPAVFRVVFVIVPTALLYSWLTTIGGFGQGTGILHLLLRLAAMVAVLGVTIWKVCLTSGERTMLAGLLRRQATEVTTNETAVDGASSESPL
jgi:O-antigen/teichoic acid export membrane protein